MSNPKAIALLSSNHSYSPKNNEPYVLRYLLEYEDGRRHDVTDLYLSGDERYSQLKWVVADDRSFGNTGKEILALDSSEFRSRRRVIIDGIEYNVNSSVVTGNKTGVVYRAGMDICRRKDVFIYEEYSDGRYEVVVHPMMVDFRVNA